MNTKTAAISIIISLVIALSLINAGSQGSIIVNELPLFAICAPIAPYEVDRRFNREIIEG